MTNAFCLSPLLLSSCPCSHFSSWGISMCGKLILQRKRSSRFFHFYFVRTPLSCQEFIKSKNCTRLQIPWLLGVPFTYFHFVVAFKLSGLLGGRTVCHMLFQWGTQMAVTHSFPVAESTIWSILPTDISCWFIKISQKNPQTTPQTNNNNLQEKQTTKKPPNHVKSC